MAKRRIGRVASFKTFLETGYAVLDENGVPFSLREEEQASLTPKQEEDTNSEKSQKQRSLSFMEVK